MNLKKNIVLVTGGSSGIGKAIVTEFLKQTTHKIIFCGKNEDTVNEAITEFSTIKADEYFQGIALDLTQENNVQKLIDFCLPFGHIHILVNNAGIFTSNTIQALSKSNLQNMLNLNVLGCIELTNAILPDMILNKSGHIINICSVASKDILSNCSAYQISKFAQYGWAKCLREELKSTPIKVTNILPGATFTKAWTGIDINPERILSPEDIAKLVVVCTQLSKQAVVEEIILRPQQGDL
ncbi:MAG: SDR family oxidoreductase [Alphaproteobacteria bacterium]|nr:SDR family oxidoreductase [Alphaproteobacteria bacterium]